MLIFIKLYFNSLLVIHFDTHASTRLFTYCFHRVCPWRVLHLSILLHHNCFKRSFYRWNHCWAWFNLFWRNIKRALWSLVYPCWWLFIYALLSACVLNFIEKDCYILIRWFWFLKLFRTDFFRREIIIIFNFKWNPTKTKYLY